MSHCRCVLFYFILLFFIARYNQNFVSIFIIVSFGIFIIIIFFSRWFINYYQDQTIILRGVLDEVDEIISELPGDEGVRILVLLPHGRLADDNPSPITYLFQLNISRVDGIWVTYSTVAYLWDCRYGNSPCQFFHFIETKSHVDKETQYRA